jgi:two-component system chemotaxis response regulator CheB
MPRIVVVGASAGGVPALLQLAASLAPDLDAMVLMVLHVGSHHSILPNLMSANSSLGVAHAANGEAIDVGRIRIAPPDFHLLVEKDHLWLSRGPKENFSRPAIDPTFRSAALAHREAVIGVVLTGRLDDGTAGLQAIKNGGGIAVVQDPAEALEPSMPQSAVDNVDVDYVAPLASIAPLLQRLVSSPPASAPAGDLEGPSREHQLTLRKGKSMEQLQMLGKPSTFTCPDCGGDLWELSNTKPQRYRCHTGHGFTIRSLQHALAETSEQAVWSALRALQERQTLLREMAQSRRAMGASPSADRLQDAANDVGRQLELMRRLTEMAPSPVE